MSSFTPSSISSKDDLSSCLNRDKIYRDSSLSSENSDTLPSTSTSFESEDDSTSCSSSNKINFDPSIFKRYIFAAAYDLESVNNADHEDSLHECDLKESNLSVEFNPFIITHTNDTIFANGLTTSSFVKDIIESSSREIREKLNKIVI